MIACYALKSVYEFFLELFACFIHSVYVCVCVFLCHLTCYQQRWPESSILLNIFNFMQEKIQVLSMVFPSEGILCCGEMLKHWLCEQSLSIITQFFCYCVIVKHMWWQQICFQLVFCLSLWPEYYNFSLCCNALLCFEIIMLLRVWIIVKWLFFFRPYRAAFLYEVNQCRIISSQLKLLYLL